MLLRRPERDSPLMSGYSKEDDEADRAYWSDPAHGGAGEPTSPEPEPSRFYAGQMDPDLRALVAEHADEIRAIAQRHRGRAVQLFGSVARGDAHENSDVDFLVEFEPGSSLFDLLHLQDDLEALLQRRVDVVSAGGLKEGDTGIRNEAIAL